jgi:hypothetical protein
MQPGEHHATNSWTALNTGLRTSDVFIDCRWPHIAPFLLFVLLAAIMTACAPGEAPPPEICDTYDRAIFTTQLAGGAALLLGLTVLGFRKNLAAILPSQGAQIGAVAGSIGLGLILLAFSTDIGNQILTGFGIESMYTLCGLG